MALARALAVDPDVLLLDEPLGALDLKLRRKMQDELKAIQRRVGTTFIHVTHDQEEAMAIADTIIVMNAGHVEDSGSPEQIYLRPKNVFAAGFMGEANLLAARVSAVHDQTIQADSALGVLTLNRTSLIDHTIEAGDEVFACFRPEHVGTEGTMTTTTSRLGDAKIVDHAFFGTHQRCQLLATDGNTYIAHLPQSLELRDGSHLPLLVDTTAIVLLRP